MNEKYRYRLLFQKFGPVRMIGHLDLMNVLQRMIRRGGIPIMYSQGFNPHQLMVIALPLSLGMCGYGEVLDIETKEPVDENVLPQKLNEVAPDGICFVSARRLEEKEKQAAALVEGAKFEIISLDPLPWKDCVADFLSQKEVLVQKQGKKGEKQVDIRQDVFVLAAKEDGLLMEISQGSARNLKPELLLSYMYAKNGTAFNAFQPQYIRHKLYQRKNGAFVSVFEKNV